MEFMFSSVLTTIYLVENIAGLVCSVFIISVNCYCYIRGQGLNPIDQIIVCLTFYDAIFSGSNGASILCSVLLPNATSVDKILSCISIFSVLSCAWFNACLCCYFFVKICDHKLGFLAQLKRNIDPLMPRIILAIHFLPIASTLVTSLSSNGVYTANTTAPALQKSFFTYSGENVSIAFALMFINCGIPTLIVTVTTAHIIVSLCKHTRHMQENVGDAGGPNLKVLRRAAYTMICLLIFYIIACAVLIIVLLSQDQRVHYINYLMGYALPSAEGAILILGNNRLRGACLHILHKYRAKSNHGGEGVSTTGASQPAS
ncbi:bitter taste receptor 52 [Xenopus tropicalis]|uniref:Taste receptor type 2 n=1 Tax=Xenopus tropicalis TaxID=8364 RepID=Q2AB35_XENTR|nr:bitter taste receptor 52 [Xenopus tropicalis]BAE80432.1 bitter taste receptor [Xenopus tropicalis]|eukprot:NP_001165506.1 bitter taste receptor 52 [Xenopus tropicalis]